MSELMEITREEYLELVNKIDALQASLSEVKEPVGHIGSMVVEKPIYGIDTIGPDGNVSDPSFKFVSGIYGEPWNIFRELAKRLHSNYSDFYIHEYEDRWGKRRGVRQRKRTKLLQTTEMTSEQKEIAADMLNEMVPIWNRYFKLVNSHVLYEPPNTSISLLKKVIDPEECENRKE
jgi:hypothetical protein